MDGVSPTVDETPNKLENTAHNCWNPTTTLCGVSTSVCRTKPECFLPTHLGISKQLVPPNMAVLSQNMIFPRPYPN